MKYPSQKILNGHQICSKSISYMEIKGGVGQQLRKLPVQT